MVENENGVEFVTAEELKRLPKKKSKGCYVWKYFGQVTPEKPIKIDLKVFPQTLSAIRYALRQWNKTHEKQLYYRFKLREEIVYIFTE